MNTTETILSIDGITIPAGSVRGLSENLGWIETKRVVRDINHAATAFRLPATRKITLSLSADGQLRAPGIAELQVGDLIAVTPASDLEESIASGASSKILQRAPITDGLSILTEAMEEVSSGWSLTDQTISFSPSTSQPLLARYRTQLDMIVTAPMTRRNNEWGATVGWSLELEEV
ncbi:MAG: hypothetical protein Alpg2KO_00800 [Alphaproteobacteria bacterium]